MSKLAESVRTRMDDLIEWATKIQVEDMESLQTAATCLSGMRKVENKIEKAYQPKVKKAHQKHKALLAEMRESVKLITCMIDDLKSTATEFVSEECERRSEQALLEEAALTKAELKRRGEEIKRLERAGEHEEAERLKNEPLDVPPVQVEDVKVDGLRSRKNWKFEVEDATKVPRRYLKVDEVALREVVIGLKDSADIPGVRVWAETSLEIRT